MRSEAGPWRQGIVVLLVCLLGIGLADPPWARSHPLDATVLDHAAASVPPADEPAADDPLDSNPSADTVPAEPAAAEPGATETAPAGAAAPVPALVVNTGGAGARLRAAPSVDSRTLEVLLDQQPVWLLGRAATDAAGRTWQQARLPARDLVGWIADTYAQPVDSPAAAAEPAADPATARLDAASRTRRVPILMYHYVGPLPPRPDQIRRGLTVSTADFDAQLDWLAAHGYQAVTLDQVAESWWGDGTLPERPVVLTFDDGYADTAELVGPRLAARGWPGVFYVITGKVGYGEYASWAQLRRLLELGMSVESHTVSHWDLTGLGDAVLANELQDARRDLREQLGLAGTGLCYPSGSFNPRARAAAVAAGYRVATTTRYGIASPAMDPLALPRLRVWGGETLAQFTSALSR